MWPVMIGAAIVMALLLARKTPQDTGPAPAPTPQPGPVPVPPSPHPSPAPSPAPSPSGSHAMTPGDVQTPLAAGVLYVVWLSQAELAAAGIGDSHMAEAALDQMIWNGIDTMTGGSPTSAAFAGDASGYWSWVLKPSEDTHIGGHGGLSYYVEAQV